jgi:hypothetical protein
MLIQGLISKPIARASRRKSPKERTGVLRVARMAKISAKVAMTQIQKTPPAK